MIKQTYPDNVAQQSPVRVGSIIRAIFGGIFGAVKTIFKLVFAGFNLFVGTIDHHNQADHRHYQ